jgi:hypothetical protein
MNPRLLASLVAAAFAIALPVAAGATVYTINVPVQLTKVAAPTGTFFAVACFLWSSKTPSQGTQVMQGQADTPKLDATGAMSGTVSVALTSTQPAGSYSCVLGVGVLPGGGTIQPSTLFPSATPLAVNGTF